MLINIIILLILQPIFVISQSQTPEKQILLKIKQQWSNQPPLTSWSSSTSPCQWHGIICSENKTVIGISMNTQNISGEIPLSICDLKDLTLIDLGNNTLTGNFPTVLYNCTKLKSLDLSGNFFVGNLPNDINKLSSNLQHLVLGSNNFSGDIPISLSQLKGLITLQMDSNYFNGTFPIELGNLENLERLELAYNSFSSMSLPKEFGNLKNLKFIWMTSCNLIGEIPQYFANLTRLEHIDLAKNDLVGEIPSGLFLLKNMTYMYLYTNMLSGSLPSSIKALNLIEIDLSENNLIGTIPEKFGNLSKLQILHLQRNNFHGSIPSSIGRLPSLLKLKLFQNRFSGILPPELGLHSKLDGVEVSDNAFTGQLPDQLCFGRKLKGVVAFNNYLNGSIPPSLGQCNTLLVVMLYNNSLSGDIPKGMWTSSRMMHILLSNNHFSGQLPEKLAWNLTSVEISNNKFSGKIPMSVSNTWRNLLVFKASDNSITGTVPLELTSLSKLNTLWLDGNQLTGELPSQINSWNRLNSLNLSHNQLFGSIPSALGSLPELDNLDLSDNQLSGKIPSELGQKKFCSLNLSDNQLTGKIPYELDNSDYNASYLNTYLCTNSGLLRLPKCQKFPLKFLPLVIFLTILVTFTAVYFIVFVNIEIWQRKHKQHKETWVLIPFSKLCFTEEKIYNNLTEKNVIGYGGSGKVYQIPLNEMGDMVAVKKIWNTKKMSRNLEKEFNAEVQTLSTIRHVNIVNLLCYISSENSRLLVYEYMENRSLDRWIHTSKHGLSSVDYPVLDWPSRKKIAMDAAKGLCYLHNDCSPPIIHRDVKSSNILLDSMFNAKIADFGLAKILTKVGGQPNTTGCLAGSFGYIAPEYVKTYKVNEKTDVYSFGVILLELVTGKEPHKGDEYSSLAEWSFKHYNDGQLIQDSFDKEILEPCFLDDMIYMFQLGLMCTSIEPHHRPSMKEVLRLLEKKNNLEDSRSDKERKDHDYSPRFGGNVLNI
ncbi:receptor-like protein kinase HSL1 [Amaranthus tricolor]|uniref:receptor-like protein kinase HSL1 n=1 Tax=Amaranthus tricolor TaxID=29722 RepID=UPI002582B714|nr:receptor-like protein kinase HSL1 [Amaranthus tricolor]